jgi:hypothetical protein
VANCHTLLYDSWIYYTNFLLSVHCAIFIVNLLLFIGLCGVDRMAVKVISIEKLQLCLVYQFRWMEWKGFGSWIGIVDWKEGNG